MSANTLYRVVRGCVQLPRGNKARKHVTRNDFVQQNDILPENVFSQADIDRLLSDGRIAPTGTLQQVQMSNGVRVRGKWVVDPVTLLGENLEALLIRVVEIDPDFDTNLLATEADAVRQLTRDWDPRFAEQLSVASDRTGVVPLTPNGVKDAGGREMSQSSHQALERARARAGADAAAQE